MPHPVFSFKRNVNLTRTRTKHGRPTNATTTTTSLSSRRTLVTACHCITTADDHDDDGGGGIWWMGKFQIGLLVSLRVYM